MSRATCSRANTASGKSISPLPQRKLSQQVSLREWNPRPWHVCSSNVRRYQPATSVLFPDEYSRNAVAAHFLVRFSVRVFSSPSRTSMYTHADLFRFRSLSIVRQTGIADPRSRSSKRSNTEQRRSIAYRRRNIFYNVRGSLLIARGKARRKPLETRRGTNYITSFPACVYV